MYSLDLLRLGEALREVPHQASDDVVDVTSPGPK
jgi:hypothetical protein